MNSVLFEETNLAGMQLQNRFVRSATSERLATHDGFVTDGVVDMYGQLADGGIGLIITGHAYINPLGKANPSMLGVDSDDKIEGLKRIPERVHKTSAKIIMQINHAGRQTTADITGAQPMAPSPVYLEAMKVDPREMTSAEIENTIQDFINAAKRVKAAGFDGLQLHAAHGYLISSFLSPYLNKRKDDWGGTPEKRCRMLIETARGIRNAVDDFPVLVKINSDDGIEGGLHVGEAADAVAALEDAGVNAVEVSGGIVDSAPYSCRRKLQIPDDEAYFADNCRVIRRHTKLPLVLVGGMRTLDTMDRVVSDGIADYVSLCRPFIREPNLVQLFRQDPKKVPTCISCNLCFKTEYAMCAQENRKRNK